MKRILWPGVLGFALLAAGCDGGGGGGPTEPDPSKGPAAVGTLLQFNTQSDDPCTNPVFRTGRVVAITQRAVVVADTANPGGGFTDDDYRALGTAFDNLVYPLDTRTFGEPTDIDGNGRVVIFFTRAVNDLTKDGEDAFVGGFFFGRDLFPKQNRTVEGRSVEGCAGSNFAEMFYLRVPDPSKTGFSKAQVQRDAVGTLAHEFQHLINQGRRLYRNQGAEPFEDPWLNEGLSHVAEELLFYQESGLGPRENIDLERLRSSGSIDAFNSYGASNFGRLITYLRNPDAASLIGKDELPTRGAAWAFLRYAADRKGGSEQRLWFDLVNSKTTGVANLNGALGTKGVDWMRDWTVSVYTDDAVSATDAAFAQPSWNFRSIVPAFNSTNGLFPLKTVPLQDGSTVPLALRAGGAAFLRFGVAPLGRAEIRTASGGAALPGSCSAELNLRVGEVFQAESNAAGLICVGGGVAGAEFTLIPFYASEVSEATVALEVTGSGIRPVLGSPNPSLRPSASVLFDSRAASGALRADERFERRLREMEIRQLAPKAGGSAALRSASAQSSATPPNVKLSLVRTR